MIEGEPGFNPEEENAPPLAPIDQRNVTLRHAVGYLEDSDTSALMKERETRRGVGAVMGRIGDRLRAGPFRRGVVMGSEDSERFKAIKEAVSDVYTGGEKLKKALGEGTTDIKNQKIDLSRIEMLVRYKEALRLSDEAVKLIREIPFADEARAIEIDSQLNNLHEHLVRLAHEDSYKILYDFEETITRKKRLSDRRFLGLASNPDFDQDENETLAEYHDRVRPKEINRTLKDVRILYNNDPQPNSDQELGTERDTSGFTPDMGKVRHYYEQADLKNVKPRPESETEHDAWAKKFTDAEKKGIYKTRLEDPYTETLHTLGSEGARDEIKKLYSFIDGLSTEKGLRLAEIMRAENISIEVKEVSRTEKFTFSEPGTGKKGGGGRATQITVETDKVITINVGEGRYHVFTIFFDGFVVPGKGGEKDTVVKQPPSANPTINYSLRHTMFARTSEDKPVSLNESTRIVTNPDKDTINKNGLYDILKEGTDAVATEIEEEREGREREKERQRDERKEVGRAVTDFSKRLVTLCRKIPQDAISPPLINRIVDSATSIRENYNKALGTNSDEGFANSLHVCIGNARAIEQLLDTINDFYASDPGFSGRTDLRTSIDNIGQISQIFQELLL